MKKYLVTTEIDTKWYWKILRFLKLKKPVETFELKINHSCFRVGSLLETSNRVYIKVIKQLEA